ncbi:MAG: hypothetical protein ABI947_17390 [Chloroflexota bacterium]
MSRNLQQRRTVDLTVLEHLRDSQRNALCGPCLYPIGLARRQR